MNKQLLEIPIGPELDATLERLSRLFEKPREELVGMLLEEAAFAIEDTFDRSGQLWDSVRFEYIHGGRRALKRNEFEDAIDEILRRVSESDDS